MIFRYACQQATTGVTLTEYLSLPENSNLKVLCEGQQVTFAFLSIKKL